MRLPLLGLSSQEVHSGHLSLLGRKDFSWTAISVARQRWRITLPALLKLDWQLVSSCCLFFITREKITQVTNFLKRFPTVSGGVCVCVDGFIRSPEDCIVFYWLSSDLHFDWQDDFIAAKQERKKIHILAEFSDIRIYIMNLYYHNQYWGSYTSQLF